MNLTLTRTRRAPDGIFSVLTDEQNGVVAHTLEHSFGGPIDYEPIIPNGEYTCVRSKHLLHGMTEPFETFEIMGIMGHTGLLFHWGNFNKDSEGCILVGEKETNDGTEEMITNSRNTFAKFMNLQNNLDHFQLIVKG